MIFCKYLLDGFKFCDWEGVEKKLPMYSLLSTESLSTLWSSLGVAKKTEHSVSPHK
jgi:hypothetical protein